MLCCVLNAAGAADTKRGKVDERYAEWVGDMKAAERGPFRRIRWFCKDGQILPPQPYGCAEFGGGSQHGEWSDKTRELREAGYWIANFYADLDIDRFVADHARSDRFAQMLIEQFLIRIDDRWILRRAQFYRGAYQEEGERRGARKLLLKLAEDPHWLSHRYLVLRSAAQLLNHGTETASVQEIRQLSAALSDRNPSFKPLRNKIHGAPALIDAQAVREFASQNEKAKTNPDYARLADLIESVYRSDIRQALREIVQDSRYPQSVVAVARETLTELDNAPDSARRFHLLSRLLAEFRDHVDVPNGPRQRLEMIDTGIVAESELFAVSTELDKAINNYSRAARLTVLGDHVYALYGTGLINRRQLSAMTQSIEQLRTSDAVTIGEYKQVLDYLALMPSWGTQRLRQFFGGGMDKLTEIEPKANLFIQDHLRGSPMLSYAAIVDGLLRDANSLAGVRNEMFGDNVGAGLRALNPGLARGTLRIALGAGISTLESQAIYLLPETVSELPPVAGILTEGEGNPLSHVQLLARNLGIPNVGIDQSLIPRLKAHDGERVVLAVSPAGSVQIGVDKETKDSTDRQQDGAASAPLIRVDLDKLDLTRREFLRLSDLRANDSGRVVGPKAAKLGELKYHYPEAVAEGLTIPFGIFKDLLEQPMNGTDSTVFEWMRTNYALLDRMRQGSTARREATEAFRARLQSTILAADPGSEFKTRLREKLVEVFGPDGTFGVFVRSDTNVEDLPGFTGAGLNLTVANVVGIDNIIAAISRVWASPFSARSFAWRQTLMDKPEHVYPAVLLMLSVNSDKSGVLVTQDIDSGDTGWLSVAVNEGVGGAVDGQSAESLRINTRNGDLRLMAAATAPIRRQVALDGGVSKLPVSSAERVLENAEIKQLIALAKQLPERFPAIVDANGRAAPADIEFGFVNGELRLFQIRPFLENDGARANTRLRELDAPLAARAALPVDLDVSP